MGDTRVSLPKVALIAVTRGMLGMGIGLLLSGRLGRDRRVAVGWTLLSIGALSTIPIALDVLGRGKLGHRDDRASAIDADVGIRAA